MKIVFLTSGQRVPSSRFRVLQYIPYLRQMGHECVVIPSRPEKYRSYPGLGSRLSQRIRRFRRMRDIRMIAAESCDVVFLERELFSDDSYDVEQQLRSVAKTLVLDIDDGLFVLHPQKFDVLVGMSDAVIVGNQFLFEKAISRISNVTTIPTCVDLQRYEQQPRIDSLENQSRATILGWTGTSANIEYLKLIEQPLNELAKRFSIELRIIAESARPLRQLNLQDVPIQFTRWNAETEIEDLRQFDIGLMPMPDTEWTRYKCGLKILQFMALGIPAVASPVGVNADIIQHEENGLLAQTPQDWDQILSRLIERKEQCVAIAAAGRQTVEQSFSIQKHVAGLIGVFDSAVTRTR